VFYFPFLGSVQIRAGKVYLKGLEANFLVVVSHLEKSKETSVVGVVPLLLFSLSCSLNVEKQHCNSRQFHRCQGFMFGFFSFVVLCFFKASARSVAIIRKFAVHFNRLLENPDVSVFSNPILKEFENILKEKK
jgi:hypothetical protein